MGVLHLVHEILDAQLVDRHDRKIGRVDALVLELRDDEPPRVAAMLLGGPVRERRVGRPMTWLGALLRAIGRVRSRGVSRIPFGSMCRLDECLHVDVDGESLEAMQVERWLAEHIICRIPGASGGERKGGKK